MIFVVGSNPSNKSTDATAFSASTRSGRTIRGWFLDVPGVSYLNVSDTPTPDNRPLTMAEIRAALPSLALKIASGACVIAVGQTAAKACRLLGIKALEMPHPSGRCRAWNDRALATEQLQKLSAHILEHARTN